VVRDLPALLPADAEWGTVVKTTRTAWKPSTLRDQLTSGGDPLLGEIAKFLGELADTPAVPAGCGGAEFNAHLDRLLVVAAKRHIASAARMGDLGLGPEFDRPLATAARAHVARRVKRAN
jgi:hypothetical protein